MAEVLSNIPIPDPTVLTTAQLDRTIIAFRELMESELAALRATVQQAVEAASAENTHLKELKHEHFGAIHIELETIRAHVATSFRERDERLAISQRASQEALTAALAIVSAQNKASETAVSKAEAATAKQFDNVLSLLTSISKVTDEKVGDLKGRLDRGEGAHSGGIDMKTTLLGLVIVATAVAGVMISYSNGQHASATPQYAGPSYSGPNYPAPYASPPQVAVVPVVPVPLPNR